MGRLQVDLAAEAYRSRSRQIGVSQTFNEAIRHVKKNDKAALQSYAAWTSTNQPERATRPESTTMSERASEVREHHRMRASQAA